MVAAQKMQVLQEGYAIWMDVMRTQGVNAKVPVSSLSSLEPYFLELDLCYLGDRTDGGFDPASVDWDDV